MALAGFAAAMFILMLLFAFMWKAADRRASQVPTADTVTITVTEKIPVPSPPDTVTKTEYKRVPVPYYIKGDSDTIVDSVLVSLPFERHTTHVEGCCDIYHSGFQSKIDSVIAYKQTTTQIIKQPYEVYKKPRLSLDLGAAAFYSENKINPCLVGEMRYNAPHTTFGVFGAVNPDGDWAAGLSVTYRINLIK